MAAFSLSFSITVLLSLLFRSQRRPSSLFVEPFALTRRQFIFLRRPRIRSLDQNKNHHEHKCDRDQAEPDHDPEHPFIHLPLPSDSEEY